MTPDSPEIVALPGGPTRVQWRRSTRARRISLRIDPRGESVVVTLPLRVGRAAGLSLLMHNAGWVADRLARLPDAAPFADGAMVPLDGRAHRIRHVPGGRGGAWLVPGADEIHVSGTAEFLPRRVGDFLRREARRRLSASAAAAAHGAGLKLRRVVVKDTRTRWGSCTADGTVMFCWRLILAPAAVQNYVVAHEVAHLKHMNHGPAFWALVAQLSPEMKPAMRWLASEGVVLLRVG